MIKLKDQVPSVYTSASRDFQYLGWLIDIVLNSVKHNVDSLYGLPNAKVDTRLAELLAMTLGFKVKRNYDQKQLAALVEALPRILKYKGTKYAVDMAGEALIAASGAVGSTLSEVVGCELRVTLPTTLVDVSLFTDLLPYILPAGMTCRIIRSDAKRTAALTKVGYMDTLVATFIPDVEFSTAGIRGLATMYNIQNENEITTFANYLNNDKNTPNLGLLTNSVILGLDENLPLTNTEEAEEA